jgi:hypothetical protein
MNMGRMLTVLHPKFRQGKKNPAQEKVSTSFWTVEIPELLNSEEVKDRLAV